MTLKSKENDFIFDQNYKNSEMGGNWVDHRKSEKIRLNNMQQVNKLATGDITMSKADRESRRGFEQMSFSLQETHYPSTGSTGVQLQHSRLLATVLATAQRCTQRENTK